MTDVTTFAITLPVTGTVDDYSRAISQAIAERSMAGDMISANALATVLSHLRPSQFGAFPGDMTIPNPAPDASPSREPTGKYFVGTIQR